MVEVSVITPVRRTDHLEQILASLKAQTAANWEWVLIPTADIRIPASVAKLKNVRVIDDPEAIGNVNTARVIGVENANGAIVVQLDDGDVLAPDALASMTTALKDDKTDIVYSDFALFPIDGTPAPNYNAEYGWVTGTIEYEGETLRSVEAFEPIPSAISHGSYAPRHGLAMKKATYQEVGGHNSSFGSASTFALVATSFIAGKKLTRIAKPLVFTRCEQYVMRDGYIEDTISDAMTMEIIREWSSQNELTMLDLGAAQNPAVGFVSVDLQDAAINCDLRYGLPLPDSSVGAIRASDFLEHMNTCPDSSCEHGADGVSPRCVVGIMNEFYRVLAPGGWLITHTPSTEGRGAFQDPTHVSYWNTNSFWYYTRADQVRFVRGITCRFQVAHIWEGYPTPWHRENKLAYVDANLIALKGQAQPGICEI